MAHLQKKNEKMFSFGVILVNFSFELIAKSGIIKGSIIFKKATAKRGIAMTNDEIVKRIVDAETRAQEIYDEAAKLSLSFDDYIGDHIAKLREKRLADAQAEISAAQKSEKARADSTIAQLDRRLEYELSKAKAAFEAEREAMVDKLYHLVVCDYA